MKNNKSNILFLITVISFSLNLTALPGWGKESEVMELKKQVELLQKRIEELENQEKQPQRPDYHQFNRVFERDPFFDMDRMFFTPPRIIFHRTHHWDIPLEFKDININETNEGYEFSLDITGFDKEKVDVQIKERSLTIKAEQSKEEKEDGADGAYQSSYFGSFLRTVPLADDADIAKAKTAKENNRLVVVVPKKDVKKQ